MSCPGSDRPEGLLHPYTKNALRLLAASAFFFLTLWHPPRPANKGKASIGVYFTLRRVLSRERVSFRCWSHRSRRYNAHLVPVIRELFSAVEAHDVCACERGSLDATRGAFRRPGKTVVPVRTPEDQIVNPAQHTSPLSAGPTTLRDAPHSRRCADLRCNSNSGLHLLRCVLE